MSKRILGLIVSIQLTAFLGFTQQVYEWRGNNRDGKFNETNLLKSWPDAGPQLIWSATDLGRGYSSPIITPENIYIEGMIDSTGYVFCLDNNGKIIWKSSFGDEWNKGYPGSRSTVTIKGDELFSLSGKGLAFKMNAKTGDIIWKVDLTTTYNGATPFFGYCEAPLLVDDVVIYTPGDSVNNIVALSQKDGSLKWSSPGVGNGDVSAYCSSKLLNHNGRRILVNMTKFHLYGVDFETGDTLWTNYNYKNWTDNCNTPLYKNGELLICSPYGAGSKLFKISDDGNSIKTLWENATFDPSIYGMIEINGFVYSSTSTKKNWMCIDWATGETKWSSRDFKAGSIVAADGLLYCYSDGGAMALIEPSPDSLKVISQFQPFTGKEIFTPPVVANGRLYLRNHDELKVYSVK